MNSHADFYSFWLGVLSVIWLLGPGVAIIVWREKRRIPEFKAKH